jgi:hypothetical protein
MYIHVIISIMKYIIYMLIKKNRRSSLTLRTRISDHPKLIPGPLKPPITVKNERGSEEIFSQA